MREIEISNLQNTDGQANAPIAQEAEDRQQETQTGAHEPHNFIGGKTMENKNNGTDNDDNVDPSAKEMDRFVEEATVDNDSEDDAEDGGIQPGRYEAMITKAYKVLRLPRMFDIIHIDFVLQTEPHVGAKIYKEYHVTTKRARDFMVRELNGLDIKVRCRDDIAPACEKLAGRRVNLSVQYPPTGNCTVFITNDGSVCREMLDPDALWEDPEGGE